MADANADFDPFDPVKLGHVRLRAKREVRRDDLPPDWRSAIETASRSAFLKEALGERLHHVFLALKRAEYRRFAGEVTALERVLYGEVV